MHSEYRHFQETLLRDLRAIFRLLRVGLHLLWAAVLVAVVLPVLMQHQRDRLVQRWAEQLLVMLGVRWTPKLKR